MLAISSLADLPSALGQLAATRAAGGSVPVRDYSAVLEACAEVSPMALYRVFEEAISDGVRVDDLSPGVREILRGRTPPEVESIAQRRGDLLRSLRKQPDELWSDALPAVQLTPAGAVDEFDCLVGRGPEAREAALEAAWASVEAGRPTLFRGVGAHWPAVQEWTVETLRAQLRRGVVRIAPSSAVTFCRESHPDVQSGAIAPPSRSFVMSTEEFDDRLRAGRRGRAPLLYDEDERVYLQALAPHAMMRQVDLSFIPSAQTAAAERGAPVLGRLWVSAPGTLSPLHYDEQDSFLCQVQGEKRLLLWSDDALPLLQPYADDHALARRLQLDLTDADECARLAAAGGGRPLEAVLRPGDVLFFGARWAHHTEALPTAEGEEATPSFSLGFRSDGGYLL